MFLTKAPLNRPVRVTSVDADDAESCRLMEMGLVEGVTVEILRRAPLGDPIQIRVGDYELSLRKSEALRVNVA